MTDRAHVVVVVAVPGGEVVIMLDVAPPGAATPAWQSMGYARDLQHARTFYAGAQDYTRTGLPLQYGPCHACGGDRWLHSETDTGPEVQACDICTGGDEREARAVQLHRINCGCDWPENRRDEPDAVALLRWAYGGRTCMPIATFEPLDGSYYAVDPEPDDDGPPTLPAGRRVVPAAEFGAAGDRCEACGEPGASARLDGERWTFLCGACRARRAS